MFEVETGARMSALKVVIYGPEGIGKSSLASQFPNPIFIDTEDSTLHMNVNRLKRPSSFIELLQMIDWIKHERQYSTVIIDTADWAQQLAEKHVLSENSWSSIESPRFGEGYVKVREEYGKMLDKLTDAVDAGINVVLTAHAEVKKFEDPTEMGAYDRYELKLAKRSNAHIAGVTKEWADIVLFLNYKTYAVKTGEGFNATYKGQGGERKMFTSHHPAYDAKNRFGLPAELPLDYSGIAHVIPDLIGQQAPVAQPVPQQTPDPVYQPPVNETPPPPAQEPNPNDVVIVEDDLPWSNTELGGDYPDFLPKELTDLMRANNVTKDEIVGVMGLYGHFPINTPLQTIAQTAPDYFTSGLVTNWDNVMQNVQSIRQDRNQLVDLFQKVGEPDPVTKVNNMNINQGGN